MIIPTTVATLLVIFGLFLGKAITAQAPIELPLWPNGIPNNPAKYKKEEMRTEPVLKSSLSQKSTILRQVSEPTYTLYTPDKDTANGVAIVVCPGVVLKNYGLIERERISPSGLQAKVSPQ